MASEQTPISKYLASLEKRQAMLTPSPAPDPAAIIRKINFEDDTFFQQDQSMSSPDVSFRSGSKRKRLSVLGEVLEEEENQQRLSELERLLQQTQGELIEARAMNTKLEHQISQNKRSYGEKIIGFESSQNEMRSKLREATEKAESFKEQVNRLSKKEEELREKVHQQTESHLTKIASVENRLRELETENLELREKFESGSLKQSDELRKLSASLEETEMGAEKWVMETQLLRDQLELKEKNLQKFHNELKDAQAIICKYNEMKSRYDPPPSPDGTKPENLTEKIRYFENLFVAQQTANNRLKEKIEVIQDENRILRSSVSHELVLENQITVLEEDVRALRAILEAKADVETSKIVIQTELTAWKKMAFKLDPDCTDPPRFETYIRRIQNQLLEARHECSTFKHSIADKDRCIAKGVSDITTLQDQEKRLTSSNENLSQEMKKLTRRLILVTKDRDGLKELKESYEQEFEGVISKPLQARINQLEATVAEYEALIQDDSANKKDCSECEKRIALVSEIRSEMERLKREKTEVETQLANVSMAGSGGTDDGDTTGVKIVSFGMNPSALSLEARLKEAIKENEELKEKLKELQDQTVAAGPSSQTSEAQKELEEKNKTLERRLEILSEAYDFETQQLQLIINKLFGFDFTLVREPTVQIRLTSTFSQIPNSAFIFQESPNGDMLLLESPILDSFRDDIERFLLRDGSIPCFLASVTITYVQNQNAPSQPFSQASVADAEAEADDDTNAAVSVHNPREVQVEVERQRHPTSDSHDEDEEDGEDHERGLEEEEAEPDDDEDMEEEEDEDAGDEMEEEDELYEEDNEDDPDDDEFDEERECEEPPPPRRGQVNPRRPPPGDDSDDSDVIMID